MSRYSKELVCIREVFATQDFIPLHAPVFPGNEKQYVLETIDSTFVSSVGAFVNRFEEDIAKRTQTKKAVAVVNGTAGLQVALRLSGVSAGDEVLTQALTFVATANSIAYNGASPVFIDVDKDTMGLSPTALQAFLEEFGEKRENSCYNKKSNRKIAACVPMHTFGLMCRMDEILSICADWNIPVVEDAAEAIGSEYKNKAAGSLGLVGVFSFNGNKIITAGGGGALVSKNEELASRAKHLTTTAKSPHKWEYVHNEMGYNFRMPNLNAALICAQLEQLDAFIEKKRELFSEYGSIFNGEKAKLTPISEGTTKWNHWLLSVQLENLEERNRFLEETNNSGVMTRPIWSLMYRLPMYISCQRDSQKNAEFLEERVVNIPSSVRL